LRQLHRQSIANLLVVFFVIFLIILLHVLYLEAIAQSKR
jgi:hypothetical protein